MADELRCFGADDPLYRAYHDEEWGRPVRDERGLYERLSLEAFQSGLLWLTILRKRENFRAAFAGFEIERVAAFGDDDFARLMADAGIVRNGAKVDATVGNAAAFLATAGEFGSFDAYLADRVPPPPVRLPMAVRCCRHGPGRGTGWSAPGSGHCAAVPQRRRCRHSRRRRRSGWRAHRHADGRCG